MAFWEIFGFFFAKGGKFVDDMELCYNQKSFENGQILSELNPKVKNGTVFQIVFLDKSVKIDQGENSK